MRKIFTVITISLLSLSAFAMFSPSVYASVAIMPTRLPAGIQAAASVWDGINAYIFGGAQYITGPVNLILRYNPSTDSISTMSTALPDPVCDMPVVWIGQYAYIFGGYVAHLHTSDNIVRYDPSTDTITVMGAKLPNYAFPLYSMSAISDGSYAYLFGGYDGYSYYDTILKYDPTSDQLTQMNARLPTGIKWNSAVWSGTHAYIFGGRAPYGASDQIVRYDPAADSVTVMSAKLPIGLVMSSSVWAGNCAYIFGGGDINNQVHDSILRYDPTLDSITTADSLPSPRSFTCAIWDGSSAYVFGGDSGSSDLDEIVRYSPSQLMFTAPYDEAMSGHGGKILPRRGPNYASYDSSHDSTNGMGYVSCSALSFYGVASATAEAWLGDSWVCSKSGTYRITLDWRWFVEANVYSVFGGVSLTGEVKACIFELATNSMQVEQGEVFWRNPEKHFVDWTHYDAAGEAELATYAYLTEGVSYGWSAYLTARAQANVIPLPRGGDLPSGSYGDISIEGALFSVLIESIQPTF